MRVLFAELCAKIALSRELVGEQNIQYRNRERRYIR